MSIPEGVQYRKKVIQKVTNVLSLRPPIKKDKKKKNFITVKIICGMRKPYEAFLSPG
jgi:hypothetical protein